jgi:hypothetical protein
MHIPKPAHSTTIGSIRLTIFGGSGSQRNRPNCFALERRQDNSKEDWYPAAGFHIGELDALAQAVEAAKQFLANPNAASAKSQPAPASDPAASAEAPTSSEAVEEPPFVPTGVSVPVPSGSVSQSPTRPTGERTRSRPKPKPTRRPTAAKGRSRTR